MLDGFLRDDKEFFLCEIVIIGKKVKSRPTPIKYEIKWKIMEDEYLIFLECDLTLFIDVFNWI